MKRFCVLISLVFANALTNDLDLYKQEIIKTNKYIKYAATTNFSSIAMGLVYELESADSVLFQVIKTIARETESDEKLAMMFAVPEKAIDKKDLKPYINYQIELRSKIAAVCNVEYFLWSQSALISPMSFMGAVQEDLEVTFEALGVERRNDTKYVTISLCIAVSQKTDKDNGNSDMKCRISGLSQSISLPNDYVKQSKHFIKKAEQSKPFNTNTNMCNLTTIHNKNIQILADV